MLRIRILLSSFKNSKKNLDSYYFVTLFDFLSLKNDVNTPSKSNKPKFFLRIIFLLASWRSMTKIAGSGPDPDPLVRGMDLRIRIQIQTKMSWIRNTDAIAIISHLKFSYGETIFIWPFWIYK